MPESQILSSNVKVSGSDVRFWSEGLRTHGCFYIGSYVDGNVQIYLMKGDSLKFDESAHFKNPTP